LKDYFEHYFQKNSFNVELVTKYMITNIIIIIIAVLLMEAFAWFSHKYIMHGFMWSWHQSHHSKNKTTLEINDLFGIIFGVMSAVLIVLGSKYESLSNLFWFGIGIVCYGFFYFIFHDIIVHQRIKYEFKPKNKYLKRIIKAHHIHHKTYTKDGAEAFGFLYAAKKYASKK
jgi:beta-carotene 3-hydroxylase